MIKYCLTTFICFSLILSLCSLRPVKAILPLSGKLIVIDPGHGGKDAGTSYQKTLEKDLNLQISLALEKELIKAGASVVLTRNGDYDLSSPNTLWRKKSDFDNRINLINNSNADYYISIHLNYLSDPSYSGPQVFYNKGNKDIAEVVQTTMNKALKKDRPTKPIPSSTYMYSKLKVDGVLIECGFMSNYQERQKLLTSEYQNKIAKAITQGLINYSL